MSKCCPDSKVSSVDPQQCSSAAQLNTPDSEQLAAATSDGSREATPASTSCCAQSAEALVTESSTGDHSSEQATSSCCPSEQQSSIDWLLWGSAIPVFSAYILHWSGLDADLPQWLHVMSHGVFELLNTMWWGVILAALFVGLLSRIPQSMVTAVLGQGGSVGGVLRATMAGVLMDLCSHGILMVGMQLYQRGASLGQVMAFLVASPWNSLSLTIILVALIGLPWTLAFVVLSMVIAIVSGVIFDALVRRKVLPDNPNAQDLPSDYQLWPEFKQFLAQADWSLGNAGSLLTDGVKGSQMVLRWLLFGILLATLLRSFVELEDFQTWFGPTLLGLAVTLVAATIIEVCSEGSTPIAADLLTRADAPGNSFAFMMTGVATDYTEVMVLKDTTRSWKIALFLPLVTVPQVVAVAIILNQF
ncbi:MAG: ATPase [Cellvibrionaceae bacterium]|nr:ATPase [Cellvibrionaceae bacterium]|tara:strand:- start:1638 stop:2888 length:1251 start_codon:yes stop_codon:yes gene_type:complete